MYKLCEEYKRQLNERKKIKYDMRNVNGGFSDGVEIKVGANAGVMDVSVDIYGGGNNLYHPFSVPPAIQKLQEAFLAAKRTGDPVASEIQNQLESYYANIRRAVSLEMVRLMQDFDKNAAGVITNAVQTINGRYQQGSSK